jgi:signal peptidase I
MPSETEKRGLVWWVRTILIGRKPLVTLIRIAVLILTTVFVFKFVLLPPVRITGPSMSPTLREGSIHLVSRLAYLRHEPRRGDIVSIRLAGNSIMYMKRVVCVSRAKRWRSPMAGCWSTVRRWRNPT